MPSFSPLPESKSAPFVSNSVAAVSSSSASFNNSSNNNNNNLLVRVPSVVSELDVIFARNPVRDRKGFFAHLQPGSLLLAVARHSALQGLQYLSEPEPEPLPTDPQEIAVFVGKRIWKPLLKDLAVHQCARVYERIVIENAVATAASKNAGLIAGGRFVRDPSQAAVEAIKMKRESITSSSSSASPFSGLSIRAEVASHVAFRVLPRTSLISNLAALTVEEFDVLASWAYNLYRRQKVENVLQDANASPTAKREAYAELAALESGGKQKSSSGSASSSSSSSSSSSTSSVSRSLVSTQDVTQELFLNALRAGVSFLLEIVGGGIGTFLLPGHGTTIGVAVGSTAAWFAI